MLLSIQATLLNSLKFKKRNKNYLHFNLKSNKETKLLLNYKIKSISLKSHMLKSLPNQQNEHLADQQVVIISLKLLMKNN